MRLTIIIIFIALAGCSSVPTAVKTSDVCIDDKTYGITYKTCASQSLVKKDLGDIQALFTAEQKRIQESIKIKYNLILNNTNTLSLKWNKVVSNISNFLASMDEKLVFYNIWEIYGSSSIDESIKKYPDVYYFILRVLKSSPTPIFVEKNGQIFLENDPMISLVPKLIEILINSAKLLGNLTDEQGEIVREIVKWYRSDYIANSSRYYYPLLYYYGFVNRLQIEKLYNTYTSTNKSVFIVENSSFKGAGSDHIGNLLLSKKFIENLDDDSLEIVMVHEAVHLLRDNSNLILKYLRKKYYWDKLEEEIKPGTEISLNSLIRIGVITLGLSDQERQQAAYGFYQLIQIFEKLSESIKFEGEIDTVVLKYFAKYPLKRKIYANLIASFESVPRERISLINTLNECIDNGEVKGEFSILRDILSDISPVQSLSGCRTKLKNTVKEYYKDTLDRTFSQNAELFFINIADGLTKERH